MCVRRGVHPRVQQSIILKSLNPYLLKPSSLSPLCFPRPVHRKGVSAGWGMKAGGCSGLDLAWGAPSSSPSVKLFHADPGVIELGHSPGSFLASVKRACLALEERG